MRAARALLLQGPEVAQIPNLKCHFPNQRRGNVT